MAESTLSVADLSSLKVADLKKELKERGLPCSGNKTELIERLQAHLEADTEDLSIGDTTIGLNDTDPVSDTKLDMSIDDSLLHEETTDVQNKAAIPASNTQTTSVVTEKPVRAKITMSDEPKGTANGHETTAKKQLSDAEKLKLRTDRFGVQSEADKKKSRAERFGLSTTTTTTTAGATQKPGKIVNTPVTAADLDKLKKRAERFGTVVSTSLSKVAEIEKLQQRSERFGTSVAPTLSKIEEQDKINKRKARFGAVAPSGVTGTLSSDDVEAKKRKRAERFGMQ
ncbi:SAP domain-containing ribonucleoprotein-like isoform X2 [Liolophura sinensis]|uniref:SAP domain-containing ribonucleoprotein-like isoform X2 n=1 Tax=Liolophura sinensis TaxID=3198878 RepID=UPI00315940C1